MRLPVYEKITPTDFSIESLKSLFISKLVGDIPCYIILPNLARNQVEQFLDNILKTLQTLRVHPVIPYPVYIITDMIQSHDELLLIKSERKLPQHFLKKSKRLKPKDQTLLNKVDVNSKKIQNSDIEDTLNELKSFISPHRTLFELSKEVDFYEDLLKQLESKGEKHEK